MKKKIILIVSFAILFGLGFFIGKNFIKPNELNLVENFLTKEELPDNFINLDSKDSLKIDDIVGDFVVSNISEERMYPDGSKGKAVTLKKGVDYYIDDNPVTASFSLYGTVYHQEEMETYYFTLSKNFFDLPILYFKNESGYNFLDNQTIQMNNEAGKILYEYWKEKGRLERGGEIYLESFDIEANKIRNLKSNPVSVY